MFGISSLGWLHTLGSLPAIPAAIYMLTRHGRIMAHSKTGVVYFISMLIGCMTVFLIAQQTISYIVGIITMILLLVGYGVGRLSIARNISKYIETICLTLTVFLLMVPTVSETLRRVPDGHPIATALNSPILIDSQIVLFIALIVCLSLQINYLRKNIDAS